MLRRLFLLSLLIAPYTFAGVVEISALPTGSALGGTEAIPAVQSGTTVQTTPGAINTYVQGQLSSSFIVGLFSTCSGTQYLGADGACHTPAAGTVTSVALSLPSVFSVSGSPVTASGTLTGAFATGQTQNEVLASPNGSSGAVSLRALVAADIPTISLTAGVSGILPSANGGTANGFFTVSGPATSAKTFTFPNASANVLTDNALVTVAQGGSGAGTLTGPIKGNGTSAFSAASSTDIETLFSCSGSATEYLRGDGTCVVPTTGFASLSAQNTFLTSATSLTGQTITNSTATGSAGAFLNLRNNTGAADQFQIVLTRASYGSSILANGPVGEQVAIWDNGFVPLAFGTDGQSRLIIPSDGTAINVQTSIAFSAYSLQVPTTGFSITLANTSSHLLLNPAGTLATGTVTMPATPSDGLQECIATSQTITSLTISANSGQTIATSTTTLVAGKGVCFIYNLSGTKWYQIT